MDNLLLVNTHAYYLKKHLAKFEVWPQNLGGSNARQYNWTFSFGGESKKLDPLWISTVKHEVSLIWKVL